jgi:hypothetical protein
MKKYLLLSASVLALGLTLFGSANAAVSGTLSGSYASGTDSDSVNLWNIDGSLTGTFGSNWGAEVTGGYHNLDLNDGFGDSLDIWNAGGSLFWAASQGRLAATVNYYSTSEFGANLNVTNYGVGGEWYAGPTFTVAVKGGADTVSGSAGGFSDSETGGYFGGMLEWYVMPNLALSGAVDYTEIAGTHATSETAKIEWMFSNTMPVSIYGGYEHADAGAGGFGLDGNAFFVGLKVYMDSVGGGALVDRQRNGSLGYIAQTPVLGISTN